eukprot:jgi/Hompol1/5143/HPOL_000848-RA
MSDTDTDEPTEALGSTGVSISEPVEEQAEQLTEQQKTIERKTFQQLGLNPWLIDSLRSLSIRQPSEIQQACIPAILKVVQSGFATKADAAAFVAQCTQTAIEFECSVDDFVKLDDNVKQRARMFQPASASPASPELALRDATAVDDNWTEEEKAKAQRSFDLFGRDFAAMASMVATKSAEQCKAFFNNNRRKRDDSSTLLIAEPSKRKTKEKKPSKRKRHSDTIMPLDTITLNTAENHIAIDGSSEQQTGVETTGMETEAEMVDPDGSVEEVESDTWASKDRRKVPQARKTDPGISEDIEKRKQRKVGRKKTLTASGDIDFLRERLQSSVGSIAKQNNAEDQAGATMVARKTISYWSVGERNEFLSALSKFGRSWDMISQSIGSKSAIQVRNYFTNMRQKLDLDALLEKNGHLTEDFPGISQQSAVESEIDEDDYQTRAQESRNSGIGTEIPDGRAVELFQQSAPAPASGIWQSYHPAYMQTNAPIHTANPDDAAVTHAHPASSEYHYAVPPGYTPIMYPVYAAPPEVAQ